MNTLKRLFIFTAAVLGLGGPAVIANADTVTGTILPSNATNSIINWKFYKTAFAKNDLVTLAVDSTAKVDFKIYDMATGEAVTTDYSRSGNTKTLKVKQSVANAVIALTNRSLVGWTVHITLTAPSTLYNGPGNSDTKRDANTLDH